MCRYDRRAPNITRHKHRDVEVRRSEEKGPIWRYIYVLCSLIFTFQRIPTYENNTANCTYDILAEGCAATIMLLMYSNSFRLLALISSDCICSTLCAFVPVLRKLTTLSPPSPCDKHSTKTRTRRSYVVYFCCLKGVYH